MTCLNNLGRRSFLKSAAAVGGASPGSFAEPAGAHDTPWTFHAPF